MPPQYDGLRDILAMVGVMLGIGLGLSALLGFAIGFHGRGPKP